MLAPLTALLVLQASLYQTIRSGLKKVLSVTVGVLVAVSVAEFIGFSWWQLTLLIAAALLIGGVLRLGDDLLEVPISAMLIFASAGQHAAAAGRVVDTLVGTAAGLIGGLAFAPLRVQPAREAVAGWPGGWPRCSTGWRPTCSPTPSPRWSRSGWSRPGRCGRDRAGR